MRYKKIVSGLLACAMAVTSVFAGNVATVRAEGEAEQPVPVSTYNFNATEQSPTGSLGEGVEAVSSSNNTSDVLPPFDKANVKFVAGRSGKDGDFAVNTEGNHGLVLPDKQLGLNYTISFWVKPTDISKGKWATSLLFVGNHEPQKWVSIATENSTGSLCCWSRGNENREISIVQDEWQMLTLVQSGDGAKVYLNGEKKVDKASGWEHGMEDADQFIALGTNKWDGNFWGCYDDVYVYDSALTDAQVKAIYDADTADIDWGAILDKEGFEVEQELSMISGRTRGLNVTLPNGISEDRAQITFSSDDEGVAKVNVNGEVTAVAAGTTTITVTVQVGEVIKTKEVSVTVSESTGDPIVVDYDFSKVVDGNIVDGSNHGNDAKLYGTEGTDYEFLEGGVLNMKSNNSGMDLPKSIMDALDDPEEFTIETTFAKSKDCGNNAWLFCFGSIPQGTGTNYMFLSPNFNGTTLRAGIKNNNNEKLFGTSIQPVIDKTYTVNMVFDHGKIRLYWNGILIQGDGGSDELNSGYSIMDDVVTPGTQNNVLGFIGKSCWQQDRNYQGKISSFKIYNKAMSNDEVQTAYQDAFQANFTNDLTAESILGNNKSKDEVRYNLSLPATYEEVPITWESLTPDVVSDAGIVTNGTTEKEAILKASITSGLLSAETEIKVKVLPADKTDLNAILAEAEAAIEDIYYSEASRANLQEAMDRAKAAVTQTAVDNAVRTIQNAINRLDYSDLYKNPFTEIDESKLVDDVALAPNGTATIFTVPESIKDIVTVTFASSDPEVAAVNEAGLVTGKNIGYASVTATVKAKYDDFEMEYQTLVKVDFDINGVTAKAANTKLEIGKTATTNISVTYPAEIAAMNLNPVVTYRATGAVSVNANGKVTAQKAGAGKVFVKVSMGGKSITETVAFDVAFDMSKVAAKAKAASLAKGKTTTIAVTLPANVKDQKPVVSYTASGAVTVSDAGKVTAKKAGTGKVTVTVAAAGKSVKKTITIKVGDISGKASVKAKKSITLKVTGISGKVKWSVNKKSLASITQKGKLTAKKAGKVKVTAKVGKVTMTKTITIKK